MTDTPPSALRNPIVWLLVGLPLAVIVAGFVTLGVAIESGGNDASPDEVRRTAQIQTTELGPDARAGEMKLSAVFSVQDGHVEVLPASGALVDDSALRARPLRLFVQHPLHAAEDREVQLTPTAAGWRAELTLDASHDWLLQLAPEGLAWRLRARLPAGQRGVLLAPAVGEVATPAADTGRTDGR